MINVAVAKLSFPEKLNTQTFRATHSPPTFAWDRLTAARAMTAMRHAEDLASANPDNAAA
jgi:hypothetical protein